MTFQTQHGCKHITVHTDALSITPVT